MTPDQDTLDDLFVYNEGRLFWRVSLSNRVKVGDEAGRINKGYRMVRLFGKEHPAHRLIWILHNGDIPYNFVIDHIDNNSLNNKIENLRLATYQQNSFNKSKSKNASSIHKGVVFIPKYNKWQAQVQISGKSFYIGQFTSESEAKEAYDEVAKVIFGEFYRA
jgi:hypothetical protein